jgi:hypothetical protein
MAIISVELKKWVIKSGQINVAIKLLFQKIEGLMLVISWINGIDSMYIDLIWNLVLM